MKKLNKVLYLAIVCVFFTSSCDKINQGIKNKDCKDITALKFESKKVPYSTANSCCDGNSKCMNDISAYNKSIHVPPTAEEKE